MQNEKGIIFQSYLDFWSYIPENERILVYFLREIILNTLPVNCKEKFAYHVPFYYGKRRICLIWPASIPRGGIKNGVLLGFAQGNRLTDPNGYLTHGTNKQIFYKIYHTIQEIDETAIVALLKNAIAIDTQFK